MAYNPYKGSGAGAAAPTGGFQAAQNSFRQQQYMLQQQKQRVEERMRQQKQQQQQRKKRGGNGYQQQQGGYQGPQTSSSNQPPWRQHQQQRQQQQQQYTTSYTPQYVPVGAQQNVSLFGGISRNSARPMSGAAKQMQARKTDLGQPMRGYIKRCYATCIGDGQRDRMESALRDVLGEATRLGVVNTRHWSTYPIPSISNVSAAPMPPPVSYSAAVRGNLQHQHQYQQVYNPYGQSLPNNNKKKKNKNKNKNKKRKQKQKQQQQQQQQGGYWEADNVAKRKRQARFGQVRNEGTMKSSDVVSGEHDSVIGTCQSLEKSYLRLTSAPDPSKVRPESVLKRAFSRLKTLWGAGAREYSYVNEQLKAIRQDMTVQGIKNEFTLSLYEWHARLSILQCEWMEFNACLTQLWMLYSRFNSVKRVEFCAYRLLYFVLERNSSEQSLTLKTLDEETLSHPVVTHALQVLDAVRSGNYYRFRVLFDEAPVAPLLTSSLMKAISEKWFQGHILNIGQAAFKKGFNPLDFSGFAV